MKQQNNSTKCSAHTHTPVVCVCVRAEGAVIEGLGGKLL